MTDGEWSSDDVDERQEIELIELMAEMRRVGGEAMVEDVIRRILLLNEEWLRANATPDNPALAWLDEYHRDAKWKGEGTE